MIPNEIAEQKRKKEKKKKHIITVVVVVQRSHSMVFTFFCISLFKRPFARRIFSLSLSYFVHLNSHKIVNQTQFFRMKTQIHIQFPPEQLLLRFYKLYFILYRMFQLIQFICFWLVFVVDSFVHLTLLTANTP